MKAGVRTDDLRLVLQEDAPAPIAWAKKASAMEKSSAVTLGSRYHSVWPVPSLISPVVFLCATSQMIWKSAALYWVLRFSVACLDLIDAQMSLDGDAFVHISSLSQDLISEAVCKVV